MAEEKRVLTGEELAKLIEFVTAFASKAVITAALSIIEAAPDNKARRRCARKLTSLLPDKAPACIACSPGDFEYTLRVYLSVAPREYRTQIDVPSTEYASDLYVKYNIAKDFAKTYWSHILRDNPGLIALLKDVNPLEWDLTVDKQNPTSMYFDEGHHTRISIVCMWVDADGKPMMPK